MIAESNWKVYNFRQPLPPNLPAYLPPPTNLPASLPFQTPSYLNVEMRDYQLEGLRWLAQSYENGVSAILGDEVS